SIATPPLSRHPDSRPGVPIQAQGSHGSEQAGTRPPPRGAGNEAKVGPATAQPFALPSLPGLDPGSEELCSVAPPRACALRRLRFSRSAERRRSVRAARVSLLPLPVMTLTCAACPHVARIAALQYGNFRFRRQRAAVAQW